MRCGHVVTLLDDLVSEELPSDEWDRVDEHLDSCPGCSALAQSYRKVIELGHRLPPLPLPAGMLQRFQQQVKALARGHLETVEADS